MRLFAAARLDGRIREIGLVNGSKSIPSSKMMRGFGGEESPISEVRMDASQPISKKRDAHDRQNAVAARIILTDPKYVEGSLMRRWALMVLSE